jgi:hypothetical protein
MVSLRIPQDVLDDLKRIAPLLGFSDYQPLLKAYIGQGLRADLERFSGRVEVTTLLDSLRKQGVEESIIANALADAQGIYQ